MMKQISSLRFTFFLAFLVVIFLLVAATLLEYYFKIVPCPLCVLQRIVMGILGIIFFYGAMIHLKKFGVLFISTLALIVSFAGMLLSGRQVWLQHIPQIGLGECGVSLSAMFKIFPFWQALRHIWLGGTECSQQGMMIINLSIAEWSLVCFSAFFLFLLIQQIRIIHGDAYK